MDVEVGEHAVFGSRFSFPAYAFLQELIQQLIDQLGQVQLNPVAGPGHDPMGEAIAQPMKAERLVVVGSDHRQNWSPIASQRRIGIEPHYVA